MAENGFRRWLYSEPEDRLRFIREWLNEKGDSRSLKALLEPVQDYMAWPRGRARPSLREFLVFPKGPEPVGVTRGIPYWREVADLAQRAGAEVRLFMAHAHNEKREAMEWMHASDERKFIVIGDGGGFQGCSFSHGCTTRDLSLIIHHRPATPDYESSPDSFRVYRALHYAAFEVGRKKGWGVHQSAALPIKDNQRFLDAFESGELKEGRDEL